MPTLKPGPTLDTFYWGREGKFQEVSEELTQNIARVLERSVSRELRSPGGLLADQTVRRKTKSSIQAY